MLTEISKRRRTNQTIPAYAKEYAQSKEIRFIGDNILLPIGYVSHRPPVHKKKAINKYTEEGRELIHKNLENVDMTVVHALMRNPLKEATIEYNDNRISLYVAQKGCCAICKEPLSLGNLYCHHKQPKSAGAGDEYENLIILDKRVHKLVHAKDAETIESLLKELNLKKNQIKKLNKLRKLIGNEEITLGEERIAEN